MNRMKKRVAQVLAGVVGPGGGRRRRASRWRRTATGPDRRPARAGPTVVSTNDRRGHDATRRACSRATTADSTTSRATTTDSTTKPATTTAERDEPGDDHGRHHEGERRRASTATTAAPAATDGPSTATTPARGSGRLSAAGAGTTRGTPVPLGVPCVLSFRRRVTTASGPCSQDGHGTEPGSIAALIARMQGILAAFPPDDPRRHFHSVYLRTTQAVGEEIRSARLGGFLDPEWVERWDVALREPVPGRAGRVVAGSGDDPRARGRWRSARRRNGPTILRCATSCSASTPT